MYSEWIATISPEAGRLLENYLMARSAVPLAGSSGRERYGYLEQNFSNELMELFAEVRVRVSWAGLGLANLSRRCGTWRNY